LDYVIGRYDDLVREGRALVDISGETVGVFAVGDDVVAYANLCRHQGGPVCQGQVMPGLEALLNADQTSAGEAFTKELHLICPWHGWEYDLLDGHCIAEPRLHLRAIPVRVRDGNVVLEVQGG